MICPICGPSSSNEWRQCPAHSDKPACIDCCHRCSNYDKTNHRCRYRLNHPVRNIDTEIEKLWRQIRYKEASAEKQYQRNNPRYADKLLYEASILRRDLNRLKEEKKNEKHEKNET